MCPVTEAHPTHLDIIAADGRSAVGTEDDTSKDFVAV
jgi:hypothetical protein